MSKARTVVEALRDFFRREQLAPGGIVIAVSGGPDSVALWRGLLEERQACGCDRLLVVAHLNHQLRGAASDADEAMVRSLFDELGGPARSDLRLELGRVDVAAEARRNGTNLEATARRVRYEWLCRVAENHAIRWIATGHTADDQAETVLHHVLRGTGLRGLAGIAPRRRMAPTVELIRPLLEVSRAEILNYLASLGQSYCEDETNADASLTRNRIRQRLLPLLAREYNPAIVPCLCRLAQQAAPLAQEQERAAQALLDNALRPRAGRLVILDRPVLSAAHRPLVRELFRQLWQREGWSAGAMGFAEWDRLAGVARGEAVAVDLPGPIHARCLDRVVQVGPRA